MQKSNPTVNRDSWLSVVNSWNPFTSMPEDKFFHINLIKTMTDPHFLRWVMLFTYYSIKNQNHFEQERQDHQFKFTLFALEKMKDVLKELDIEDKCGINCGGALRFHYPDVSIGKTKNPSISTEPITNVFPGGTNDQNLFELESSALKWPKTIEFAEFESESCAGNCEIFTKLLSDVASKKHGVRFLMNTEVKALDITDQIEHPHSSNGTKKRIQTIHTNKGRIEVDENTEVVIAAGSWTPKLLWMCGYFTPIYPMKGYSVAIDLPEVGSNERPVESDIPSRMLIDKKMYISRLGDQVRVTSMGEFCGWDTNPDPEINKNFRVNGRTRVPALQSLFDATPTRCGLRPFSADGIIILGRVDKTANLFVNVGPGFNGWKISIGAANVLVNLIERNENEKYAFDSGMFSPYQRIVASPLWSLLSRMRWSW
jgi:hypothetical protein